MTTITYLGGDRIPLWSFHFDTATDADALPTITAYPGAPATLTVTDDRDIAIAGNVFDPQREHFDVAVSARHFFIQHMPGIHHPGERILKAHAEDGDTYDRGKLIRHGYTIKNAPKQTGWRAGARREYLILDVDGVAYSNGCLTLKEARGQVDRIAADEALLGRRSPANGRADDNLAEIIRLDAASEDYGLGHLGPDCVELWRARHGSDLLKAENVAQ